MAFIKVTKMKRSLDIRVNTDNVLFYEPIKYENGEIVGTMIWFTGGEYIEIVESPDDIDRLVKEAVTHEMV